MSLQVHSEFHLTVSQCLLACTIFVISLARHRPWSWIQRMLSNLTHSQAKAPSPWVITSNNWFVFPGMTLLTLTHNLFFPSSNNFSLPYFHTYFFLLHLDQKVKLVCFSPNKNAQLVRQLFWVARTRPNGSTARTPRPVKAPFMLLFSYLREPGVSLKKPASSLMLEQNKHKTRFERKRRVLPSLPWLRNQGRVNKVYQACDQYTEWAC